MAGRIADQLGRQIQRISADPQEAATEPAVATVVPKVRVKFARTDGNADPILKCLIGTQVSATLVCRDGDNGSIVCEWSRSCPYSSCTGCYMVEKGDISLVKCDERFAGIPPYLQVPTRYLVVL